MRLAQILNNRVNWIVVDPENLQKLRDAGLTILDECDAEQNAFYDGETFTPEVIYKTQITAKEFWGRWTENDQDLLASSNNAKIKSMLYKLSVDGIVNLKDSKLITAVETICSNSAIESEADNILRIETNG